MRADNHGEGGILALTALVMPEGAVMPRGWPRWSSLGVFGTALLYGDGSSRRRSRCSARSRASRSATPAFEQLRGPDRLRHPHRAVPRPAARHGAASARCSARSWSCGSLTIGAARRRARSSSVPSVLRRRQPACTSSSFFAASREGVPRPRRIFLVVTGGEALYADMGHFGRRPISVAWYCAGAAGLVLNYFGQAALLLPRSGGDREPVLHAWRPTGRSPAGDPGDDGDGDRLAGADLRRVLAHRAGGAARLPAAPRDPCTRPREHTGQVYVPLVNWALMVGSRRAGASPSGRRATWPAAYGIAVTARWLITTLLFYRRRPRRSGTGRRGRRCSS